MFKTPFKSMGTETSKDKDKQIKKVDDINWSTKTDFSDTMYIGIICKDGFILIGKKPWSHWHRHNHYGTLHLSFGDATDIEQYLSYTNRLHVKSSYAVPNPLFRQPFPKNDVIESFDDNDTVSLLAEAINDGIKYNQLCQKEDIKIRLIFKSFSFKWC